KRYVSESLFYFDPVLMEIGRRSGLSLKQVRFLRTKDVKDILLQKKDFTDETNNRIKLSAWVTKDVDTEVYTRKTAQDMYKTLVVFDKNAREFQGMPVSPGIARGPVRIIMNPDEINKVKKGDIIVSVQVVPSFSPAIHRAAGLICDGGHGITTHPAILAREAKIPAIIQTFFARKILKDGDMVEVDGFKGIARRLN
ncbi:MAG: PEP-utilizing enzyme, partial [bacterium]|nr:PEP-utilizing enzyme [bacterium]